jgi:hypothetical protein
MLVSDLAGSALVALYHSQLELLRPAARTVSGSGLGTVLFYIGSCRNRMENMECFFLQCHLDVLLCALFALRAPFEEEQYDSGR